VINKGRKILTDPAAESANVDQPAFIAKPEGAPVYHGFLVVEESETDGWRYGAITEFIGAEYGDGFVIAPDGSRAGLVWEVGDGKFQTVMEPEKHRWGVYAVWFPKEMKNVTDLVSNFQYVLPLLKRKFEEIRK
jgi:hypothetical protein